MTKTNFGLIVAVIASSGLFTACMGAEEESSVKNNACIGAAMGAASSWDKANQENKELKRVEDQKQLENQKKLDAEIILNEKLRTEKTSIEQKLQDKGCASKQESYGAQTECTTLYSRLSSVEGKIDTSNEAIRNYEGFIRGTYTEKVGDSSGVGSACGDDSTGKAEAKAAMDNAEVKKAGQIDSGTTIMDKGKTAADTFRSSNGAGQNVGSNVYKGDSANQNTQSPTDAVINDGFGSNGSSGRVGNTNSGSSGIPLPSIPGR